MYVKTIRSQNATLVMQSLTFWIFLLWRMSCFFSLTKIQLCIRIFFHWVCHLVPHSQAFRAVCPQVPSDWGKTQTEEFILQTELVPRCIIMRRRCTDVTPAAEEAGRRGELSLCSDPRTRQALNMFGLVWKLNSTLCWMMWRLHVAGAWPEREIIICTDYTPFRLSHFMGSSLKWDLLQLLFILILCHSVTFSLTYANVYAPLLISVSLKNGCSWGRCWGIKLQIIYIRIPWGPRGPMTTGSRELSGKWGQRV